MDMAFLRRVEQLLSGRTPARLDHSMLVASLAAQRAAEAGAAVRKADEEMGPQDEEALVELLVAGPGWRQAVSAQHGCFSRAEVKRRSNVR